MATVANAKELRDWLNSLPVEQLETARLQVFTTENEHNDDGAPVNIIFTDANQTMVDAGVDEATGDYVISIAGNIDDL